MPGSSGRHSQASKIIDETYGKTCIFCGESTGNVTKAHLIAGNKMIDYTPFGIPTYKDDLDVKSARNFLPLCGTEGQEGTCHNEFDKFLMSLLYDPFSGKYSIFCFNTKFSKYTQCHGKEVAVNESFPPYRRILAWRFRKCIQEQQYLIRPEDIDNLLRKCEFSEKSKSVADEDIHEDYTLATSSIGASAIGIEPPSTRDEV